MTRKLIASLPATVQGGVSAKVYRDSETYGFVVQFYRAQKHLPKADYETDDKADALQTAELEVQRGNVTAFTATPNTIQTTSTTQRKRAARRAHSARIDGPIPRRLVPVLRGPCAVLVVLGPAGQGVIANYPATLGSRPISMAQVRADCRWH